MRILLVNPNMSTEMTDTMSDIARRTAGPDVEIVPLTAPRGFPYIASRAEAQIAGGIAFEMIADNLAGVDAVVMAAFGDPGLRGARELFDLPVVGMAEAAMMSAAMLGERFSIITFSPIMRRSYLDCARDSGLMARCCGVRTPTDHPDDVGGVREALRGDLIALAREAVERDGADVIIMGGAAGGPRARDRGRGSGDRHRSGRRRRVPGHGPDARDHACGIRRPRAQTRAEIISRSRPRAGRSPRG